MLNNRYTIVEILSATVWGATYAVTDGAREGARATVEQVWIPPLRESAELDARLQALEQLVSALRHVECDAVARIHDFFRLDNAAYVVMERRPSTCLARLIEADKLPGDPAWLPRLALQIAQALQAFVKVGQRRAVESVTPESIYLVSGSLARVYDAGFSSCFQPPGPCADRTLEAAAIRRFGMTMYTVATGLQWKADTAILQSALPESVRSLVLRCLLLGRSDAYASLDPLIADLQLFAMASQESEVDLIASAPDVEPAPWVKLGVFRFLLMAVDVPVQLAWKRFRALRPVRKAAAAAALLAVLAAVVPSLVERLLTPGDYLKAGAVVYSACADGRIHVFDASSRRELGRVRMDFPVRSMVCSAKTGTLYAALPPERRLVGLNTRDNSLAGSVTLQAGATDLLLAGPDLAYCLGAGTVFTEVRLPRITPTRVFTLDHPPTMGVSSDAHLLLAVANPPGLRLFSPGERRVVEQVDLPAAPLGLAMLPSGKEAWVLLPHAVVAVDALTLTTVREIQLEDADPIGVAFSSSSEQAWMLARDGRVLTIDVAMGRVTATLVTGRAASSITQGRAGELWIGAARPPSLVIVDAFGGRTIEKVPLDSAPTALVAVP